MIKVNNKKLGDANNVVLSEESDSDKKEDKEDKEEKEDILDIVNTLLDESIKADGQNKLI